METFIYTFLLSSLFMYAAYLIFKLGAWPLKRFYYRHIYQKLPHWRRFSLKAKKAAGYVCQVRNCTQRSRLITHHQHYYSMGHEKLSDVVVLCFGHHVSVENGHSFTLKNGGTVNGYKKQKLKM